MQIKKDVFRAYDIRGFYGTDINEEFAYILGRALVRFLRGHKKLDLRAVLVNRDLRSTSAKLYSKLIDGMTDEGVAVFDGGAATTPMHYFGVGTFDVQAGVMVTPSHGAPGMCGFKISTKTERIASETGLHDVYRLMRQEFPPPDGRGTVRPIEFLDKYVSFLKSFARVSPLSPKIHVVLDACGGPAGMVLQKLLPSLAVESTNLFFDADPEFARHDPNPLFTQSQAFIKERIQKSHQDFGVLFDGDADRIVFFNERGEEIAGDYITAIISEEKLRLQPYKEILVDVNASRDAVRYIEARKGIVRRIRVGTAFFRNELERARDALMGAESSGHFYYPEFFNSDGAVLTFLYVLNILAASHKPLSELVSPMQTSVRSGEINFEVSDKDAVMGNVKRHFSDGALSTIDGIAIEYPEWRFTLRPSNTDPVIRLHIEADTKDLLEEKRKILEGLIRA